MTMPRIVTCGRHRESSRKGRGRGASVALTSDRTIMLVELLQHCSSQKIESRLSLENFEERNFVRNEGSEYESAKFSHHMTLLE